MPTHKTKFNKQWLASTDENGDIMENGASLETLYTLSDACFAKPSKRCLVLIKVNNNCQGKQCAKGENRRKYLNNQRGQGILALVCGPKDKEKDGKLHLA